MYFMDRVSIHKWLSVGLIGDITQNQEIFLPNNQGEP